MPSTGKQNGLIALYHGGTKVAHATDASLSVNGNTVDVTSKDSAFVRDLLYGITSWSMSGSAFFAEDATEGFTEMFANLTGRQTVTVLFSTEVTGDLAYSGTCLVTSLEMTGGVEDAQTFSFSFEGTGALTEAAVSA